TFIDASVIGENNGPYDNALILSAGRENGVTPGQAVVDDGGLLGHVITAGNSAARILLITDYESQVPVFIEDLEVEALLAGRSTGMPVLEIFAERRAVPIKPGGRVVTSGADGLLPRGLPVGEVARVDEGVVYVDLYANTRTPDLVRVVEYAFPSDVEDPTPATEETSALGTGISAGG
ncbi:MAG: rod shape-determining protein MreC, partial [Pseudomonadota bacterium]